MFVMFFNVVFSMFVCYCAAFCQLCFYNKDWIGLALFTDYHHIIIGLITKTEEVGPAVTSYWSVRGQRSRRTN